MSETLNWQAVDAAWPNFRRAAAKRNPKLAELLVDTYPVWVGDSKVLPGAYTVGVHVRSSRSKLRLMNTPQLYQDAECALSETMGVAVLIDWRARTS